MESILADALEDFDRYSGWIVWNLFLAFIPLVLSFWLFRWQKGPVGWLWWIGAIAFIAFLPNAPYMLTDIVHLIKATQAGYSIWIVTLIFIPLHLVAILAGFEAYVISLLNQGYYLKQRGAGRFVFQAELIDHALCAIGIFLGRFLRYNSWDLVTRPKALLVSIINSFTAKQPLLVMLITFVAIAVFYWVMKQVTLGLMLQIRASRDKSD